MKKNKIKTKRAAAKRFKITGTGKIRHYNSGLRHLLNHESSKKKNNKSGTVELVKTELKKVKRMLGMR
jgi:large subunit ribosomal protein L35